MNKIHIYMNNFKNVDFGEDYIVINENYIKIKNISYISEIKEAATGDVRFNLLLNSYEIEIYDSNTTERNIKLRKLRDELILLVFGSNKTLKL